MFSKIASQLCTRAEWLLAGRFDAILADHRFPLPVDFGASRLVVRTADEGRMLLSLMPTITALDLPRGGRFRIWADWHGTTREGSPLHLASVIYYCRQVPGGLRIEMVDCTRLLIRDLHPELVALALSA